MYDNIPPFLPQQWVFIHILYFYQFSRQNNTIFAYLNISLGHFSYAYFVFMSFAYYLSLVSLFVRIFCAIWMTALCMSCIYFFLMFFSTLHFLCAV